MKLRIFATVIFLPLLGESPGNNLSSSTNQVTEYQQYRNSAEAELNQLLAERIKHPENTLDIDNKIYETLAVLPQCRKNTAGDCYESNRQKTQSSNTPAYLKVKPVFLTTPMSKATVSVDSFDSEKKYRQYLEQTKQATALV